MTCRGVHKRYNMIDEPLEFGALHAWPAPASVLVDDVARLCIAAGIDLCAVYPVAGSRDPIAFEQREGADARDVVDYDQLVAHAERAGFSIARESIAVAGAERAYAVFGRRGAAPAETLVRSACALFASAMAQSERLAHYHRVSDRLQRALLPGHLVQASGLRFDAAYSPGSTEAEVGGDWYDAFEMQDGLICVSVGDVTGHGLDAAVTMSEMRRAIRTAVTAHDSPAAALNAVDAIASAQRIGIASALLGYFDARTATLRYACAGHPVPILLTGLKRAYPMPGGGTLLGLGLSCASPERTLTLPPGGSVVLYTDGLIEYDRDIMAGEQRLIGCIEELAKDDVLGGQALHDLVLAGGQRDDCATLIVSRAPVPSQAAERYTFCAIPQSARLLRDAIRDFAERCGITGDRQFSALVGCGEAIANAIEHGEQEPGTVMSVELSFDGTHMTAKIENRGHWRTSMSEHRGRGISIMRSYAARLELSTSSERTCVSLTF